MPSWKRRLIAWFFVPVHSFLFRLSGGRLLGRLESTDVLILVTKGRKSGKQRVSPLLYFRFEEAGDFVIVASNYGQDHHPAWYLNVVADPNVMVEIRGERFSAMAHVVRGDDRIALFDRVIAANSRFATYRASTEREIPIVTLRRAYPGA